MSQQHTSNLAISSPNIAATGAKSPLEFPVCRPDTCAVYRAVQ